MQQCRPAAPVADDKNRRPMKGRFLEFSAPNQLLHQPKTSVDGCGDRDRNRHRPSRRVDRELAVTKQTPPYARAHAMPKTRRVERIMMKRIARHWIEWASRGPGLTKLRGYRIKAKNPIGDDQTSLVAQTSGGVTDTAALQSAATIEAELASRPVRFGRCSRADRRDHPTMKGRFCEGRPAASQTIAGRRKSID